jgi:hypothetical protein
MSENSNDVVNKMSKISETYNVPLDELRELVKAAKDEVEVPDCSDCTHKRFHDNRGGLFV